MTSSFGPDHKPRKPQFSKSGIPLHMLGDIEYMEFAMEFPEEVIDIDDDKMNAEVCK
tara:strand:- start:21359 stop:21529 length:171 start_codon:yes stop_codon:yes gene_type:complete